MKPLFSVLVIIFMLFFNGIGKYHNNNRFLILGKCKSSVSLYIVWIRYQEFCISAVVSYGNIQCLLVSSPCSNILCKI